MVDAVPPKVLPFPENTLAFPEAFISYMEVEFPN